MQCQVKDIMTCETATVPTDATIDDVSEALVSAETAEVYVTDDDGRLHGVVPDYELLKARMAHIAGTDSVERLICRSLATVHPESPIDAVTAAFRESSRRTIAVCEAGRLVGQIRRYDVLRQIESMRTIEQVIEAPQPGASEDVRAPRFAQAKQSVLQTSVFAARLENA